MKSPLTKINLSDGKECSIYEPSFLDMVVANHNCAMIDAKLPDEDKRGIMMYIFQQIIKVDNQKLSFEEFGELPLEDYTSIMSVVEVALKKIKL